MKKRKIKYSIILLFLQITIVLPGIFMNTAYAIDIKTEYFLAEVSNNGTLIDEAEEIDASDNQLSYSNSKKNEYTFEDFLLRFMYYLIVLVLVLVILSLLVIYTIRLKKKHYETIRNNEMRLLSITNNINGGVLVILPQKGYRMIFVNDGYLKMLQYSRDEYDSLIRKDYISFIHPNDRKELNKILKLGKNENFSAQMRIMRKDGKYIPTIFSGALVDNEGEDELHCIVMDISREHSILQRLEFEQERYRTLIDKSDEILYEVNFLEQTTSVSKKFEEKFGWTWPEKYWGEEIPDLLHIFEGDRDEFGQMLKAINEDIIDGECTIRIYDDKFQPRWCKILFHVIKKDGVRTWLIGKLADIDEEMKEKQALLQKAEMDALTGIYNKEAFKTRCEEYLKTNPESNCAIIFFDIDNFKEINDNFGHAAGDKVLKDISLILKENFRENDFLGRFGGDEFCILVKDISKDSLNKKLNQLVQSIRDEYISDQHVVYVSASIGAACSTELGSDFEILLDYADKALYYAKEHGKNSYVIYYDGLCLAEYSGIHEK